MGIPWMALLDQRGASFTLPIPTQDFKPLNPPTLPSPQCRIV